jgi:two-component system response regulator HydG
VAHLLLIDDESATRLVMHSRLRDAGYDVTVADSGAQGLHVAREHAFDVILIDADLGAGISGIEVCRRLSQAPHTAAVPIVLLSKRSGREDLPRGYEAGCASFLVKSDAPILEHVLRVLTRFKREHDELRRQSRGLEDTNRRLVEERQRIAESEHGSRAASDLARAAKSPVAARPDGVLVVDDEGIVRFADRGARDCFGPLIEGKNLGLLAPATRLEAFVRDSRGDARDGLRFDLPPRNGRAGRSLAATVVPLVANPGEEDPGLRIVVLLDTARHKLAAELWSLQEYTLPRREVGVLLEAARIAYAMSSIAGESAATARIRAQVEAALASPGSVLLVGERGVGKQHVARVLHFGGGEGGPFLPIHCAGLSPEHLEVELFGEVRGATPEAHADRPGAFQQAAHGTVFLADVESLPAGLQQRVLRAIREHAVERAGGDRSEAVDVRVIASTTADVAAAVAAGQFDRALFEELSALTIVIPALRERREDIPVLARHFLKLHGRRRGGIDLTPAALEHLDRHFWPENVRELERCIERACRASPVEVVDVEHLTSALRDPPAEGATAGYTIPRPSRATPIVGAAPRDAGRAVATAGGAPSDEPISFSYAEKTVILRALAATGGDKIGAARLLNVGKSTLYRKLKRHGIA